MASWRLVPRLPLLSKELLEISARKRTYEDGWLAHSSCWFGVVYVGFHVLVWRILRGTSLALSERLLRRGGP
ncbi:MAG: hypothetical protein H0W83_06650 [Planctomycetes bacterium]|nr:hypothetical protein [Planctomycetota bacterium]